MQILTGIAVALLLLVLIRAVLKRREAAFPVGIASRPATPPTEDSIRDALRRGRKIEAIKAYRTLHRVDLKTAKEAVEQIAAQRPPSS